MDLQAMDRAHRIGQRKPVFVYRFAVEGTVEERIVDRAQKKLFLDQVVIKQGKLIDNESKLTANELQDMVKHGVNEIFHGSSKQHDDDINNDIDTILNKGKQLATERSNKLQSSFNNNLLSFDSSDAPSTLVFEGKDYRDIRNADHNNNTIMLHNFIEPPKRSTKNKNYSERQEFHQLIYGTTGERKEPVKREFKPTQRFDFQFFNINRLEELERKEFDANVRLVELKRQRKEELREKRRQQKELEIQQRKQARYQKRNDQKNNNTDNVVKQENDNDDITMKHENNNNNPTEQHNNNDINNNNTSISKSTSLDSITTEQCIDGTANNPMPSDNDSNKDSDHDSDDDSDNDNDKQHNDKTANDDVDDDDENALYIEAGMLTNEEQDEKQRLLDEGFGDWTKRDFQQYIKALEKYGRDSDIEQYAQVIDSKSVDDIKEYHNVFMKRYREIDNIDKYISNIEKGEEKLRKLNETNTLIKNKILQCDSNDILGTLSITYPAAQKSYTELEDKYIIYVLSYVGYSNWVELQIEIQRSYIFRFDWYIKSRNISELSRRSEYLVKILQKEAEEAEKLRIENEKKRKKAEQAKAARDRKKKAEEEEAKKKAELEAAKKHKKKTSSSKSTTKQSTSSKNKHIDSSDDEDHVASSKKSQSHKASQSNKNKTKSHDDNKKRKDDHDDHIQTNKKHKTNSSSTISHKNKKDNDNNKHTSDSIVSKTPSKTPIKKDNTNSKIDTFFKPKDKSDHSPNKNNIKPTPQRTKIERQNSLDKPNNNNNNITSSSDSPTNKYNTANKKSLSNKSIIPKKNQYSF